MAANRRATAFHYVAEVKGREPVRFYRTGGTIADSAARAFSKWARSEVTLWPTHDLGEYRATWFDRYADAYRETTLTILEEARR